MLYIWEKKTSMTREDRIHWIENKMFEKKGMIGIKAPVTYDYTKGDIATKLTMFMGEPVMVYMMMSGDVVPIDRLSDDGIENLFRVVCR